jgi:trigger factor
MLFWFLSAALRLCANISYTSHICFIHLNKLLFGKIGDAYRQFTWVFCNHLAQGHTPEGDQIKSPLQLRKCPGGRPSLMKGKIRKDFILKIETTPLDDHQVKLRVEVEADQLETAKRRAARQIAKKAKIPGFRPGKAPYHIIERFAGEGAILEDALDLLVKDIYPQALEESKIQPYGPGTLENVPSTEPPVFEFVVPLQAEVKLGDYHSLRIPYELKEITDEDVAKVIETIRDQQAVLEPVERPSQDGDQLQIHVSARYTQVEEGEKETLLNDRSAPVILGADDSDTPEEWPFPGFSSQLVGLSEGDQKTILHTFADDSPFEELRGKEAEFHVRVENVKARSLPEINDEFAQSQGEFENLAALQDLIRKNLEDQAKREYHDVYEEKLFEELLKVTEIKYPPQLIEHEIDGLVHQLGHRIEQQGLDMDTYLKSQQMEMEALREELKPTAETRARRQLALIEVARLEKVQVDPQEVQSQTLQTLNTAAQDMSPTEIRNLASQDMVSRLAQDITYDLLIHKTTDRLISIFKGDAEVEEKAQAEAIEAQATGAEVTEAEPVEVEAAEKDQTQAAEGGQVEVVTADTNEEAQPDESEPAPLKQEAAGSELQENDPSQEG